MAGKRKGPWSTALALAILVGFVAIRYIDEPTENETPPDNAAPVLAQPEASGDEAASSPKAVNGYDLFHGCRLVDHRHNDGDSFHVRLSNGEEVELRLYFVDTPESRRHQYNGERIGHQARYFGLSSDEAVELGAEAKHFVLKLLDQGEFSVFTKWAPVFKSDRFYAFIAVDYEGQKMWLHELLVKRGYARIYTEGATMPGGQKSDAREKVLRGIERDAKDSGVGGWAR